MTNMRQDSPELFDMSQKEYSSMHNLFNRKDNTSSMGDSPTRLKMESYMDIE